METEVENARPNIRIQIVNDISDKAEERMDVDGELDENEEGEISDDNEPSKTSENMDLASETQTPSGVSATFTTGINVFDKNEQQKLQERAKRFALKPHEIHSFSDQDLQDLHMSLGITPLNQTEIKFQTLYLLGLDEMSAEDIVDYFAGYAPEGIEWIDENTCNVVWLDNLSAARALHFKSKAVRDMPAREPKDLFPKEFLDDVEEPDLETGQSILVKNKNREIELRNELGEIILPNKKVYPKDSVDISEITIPIPPGYWRLGLAHLKSKCLLVRFGKTTDKLPFKSEKCSKYYKKLSNSNPLQRNVISESKKKELRSIFERNKELNQSKNPWGSLAKNWDKDARFREREPVMPASQDEEEVTIVEVKNPKLLARLGTKRKHVEEENGQSEDTEDKNSTNKPLISERKKIKLPRMKMYADEEEENQKRRKILMRIKSQTEEINRNETEIDLRNMLGPANRLLLKSSLPEPDRSIDLASRLKNRSQKMVFAVEREPIELDYYEDYDTRPPIQAPIPDIRRELMGRHFLRQQIERERERSPLYSRSVLIRSRTTENRQRVPLERHSIRHTKEHTHRSRRSSRRTPERTLHSDHLHSSRSTHLRRRSHTPDSRRSNRHNTVRSPRKPTVASTIWSKVKKTSESEKSSSESESESEEESGQSSSGSNTGSGSESSSSSEESASESGESESEASESSAKSSDKRIAARNPDRPGFDKSRLSYKVDHKSPLKITTTNDHYGHQKKSKKT